MKLAGGHRVARADLDEVTADLARDKSNPYKHMVAGEVMAALGLFGLAADEFSRADNLQNDYVLNHFKQVVDSNQFIPNLFFEYLQDKYSSPPDPAVLLYAARRNLAEPTFKESQKQTALSNARKELLLAAGMSKPWRGTFATLSMLEYNAASELPPGSERNKKLDLAVNYANRELAYFPDELLAQKLKLLAYCRKGKQPWELVQPLSHALKAAPLDADLNLLFSKACLYRGDSRASIKPALIGLLYAKAPSSLSEAREQVYDLIRETKRSDLLPVIDEVASGQLADFYNMTKLRIHLAELFSIAGDGEEACRQFKIALNMHPYFQGAAAFKLANQLVAMHEYFQAYPYILLASSLNRNPNDEARLKSFKLRIARVGLNSQRDLALKLKTIVRALTVSHS